MRRFLALAALAAFFVLPMALRLAQGTPPKAVEVQLAGARELKPLVVASGSVAYGHEVNVSSEIIGRVDSILVAPGQRVAAGQPLMALAHATNQAQVDQAAGLVQQSDALLASKRRSLEFAQATLDSYRPLLAVGMVERLKFEQLERDVGIARADLRSAEKGVGIASAQYRTAMSELSKTVIRSPLDGVVLGIPTKPGEVAVPSSISLPGSVLLTVADTARTLAEVDVSEADIVKVAVGDAGRVFVVGARGRPVPARVVDVGLTPRTTAGARVYPVRLDLLEAAAIRSGMSCRVEIAVRGAPVAVAVPQEAVLSDASQVRGREVARRHVFVVADGRARRREVSTGASDDEFVEIAAGLHPGDRVVTGPANVLRLLREDDAVAAPGAAR
jgi:HlyD family secretion protein